MSNEESTNWIAFQRGSLGRPPRELLTRTLNFFAVEGAAPGVAIDLGCGSGPDTLELLRQGWRVHAVDTEPWGLQALRAAVPPEHADRLHTYTCRFESFDFPPCDLVWAGFALPFCPRAAWSTLVNRIARALNPGGRFAGDLFGDKHAWSGEDDVLTLTKGQARQVLAPFVVEAFDIEDGYRVSGGQVTRWHAFGFAARKAVATVMA